MRLLCFIIAANAMSFAATDNCHNPLIHSDVCINLSLCPPAGVNIMCTFEYDPVCGKPQLFQSALPLMTILDQQYLKSPATRLRWTYVFQRLFRQNKWYWSL